MAQARKPTKLVFRPTAPANVPTLEEQYAQDTVDRDTMKCGGSGCGAFDEYSGAVKGWVPGQ